MQLITLTHFSVTSLSAQYLSYLTVLKLWKTFS
jgi:hypothetical protein